MNDISPSDPTYAETFARLSKLIAQEEREHGRIAEMSQASLRDWLNGFMQEAAKVLGIAAAKIAAMVADYVQISREPLLQLPKDEFRKSYKASRRIGPL